MHLQYFLSSVSIVRQKLSRVTSHRHDGGDPLVDVVNVDAVPDDLGLQLLAQRDPLGVGGVLALGAVAAGGAPVLDVHALLLDLDQHLQVTQLLSGIIVVSSSHCLHLFLSDISLDTVQQLSDILCNITSTRHTLNGEPSVHLDVLHHSVISNTRLVSGDVHHLGLGGEVGEVVVLHGHDGARDLGGAVLAEGLQPGHEAGHQARSVSTLLHQSREGCVWATNAPSCHTIMRFEFQFSYEQT